MMKTRALLIVFIFCNGWLLGQQTRILFLGNSYTYVNDLPGTLSQLALSMGDSIYYESNTPGGYMLNQHCNDPTTLAKIGTPGWDYVVIQAQSQEPALDSNAFYFQTYPRARKLDSLIHVTNPCAITLFYMTWGRKYGDSYWCPVNPPMCTFAGMNLKLRERYVEMATDNFSRVAPVGVAWKNSWDANASIDLWDADNSHPSVAGTYLAACVFYASIFKESPVGSSYLGGLSGADALFLQNIAAHTVLDSMDNWMLEQVPIHVDFSDTINQSLVNFYPSCYNTSAYWWDFGDGIGFSSLPNSNYYYSNSGTYPVKLIGYNECYTDSAFDTVTITTIGIHDEPEIFLSLSPNPVKEILFINGNIEHNADYSIINMQGEILLRGVLNTNTISVSDLKPGVYLLRIEDFTIRFIRQE